eukprot:8563637-Pyramimonas_sp.AAC.3
MPLLLRAQTQISRRNRLCPRREPLHRAQARTCRRGLKNTRVPRVPRGHVSGGPPSSYEQFRTNTPSSASIRFTFRVALPMQHNTGRCNCNCDMALEYWTSLRRPTTVGRSDQRASPPAVLSLPL